VNFPEFDGDWGWRSNALRFRSGDTFRFPLESGFSTFVAAGFESAGAIKFSEGVPNVRAFREFAGKGVKMAFAISTGIIRF
jgi:hypothetical protein